MSKIRWLTGVPLIHEPTGRWYEGIAGRIIEAPFVANTVDRDAPANLWRHRVVHGVLCIAPKQITFDPPEEHGRVTADVFVGPSPGSDEGFEYPGPFIPLQRIVSHGGVLLLERAHGMLQKLWHRATWEIAQSSVVIQRRKTQGVVETSSVERRNHLRLYAARTVARVNVIQDILWKM